MGREDEIRVIAYNIWEEEGRLDGRDYEHWLRAEAIWEQRQEKQTEVKKTKIETKLTPQKSTKAGIGGKKSQRS